MSLNEPYKVFRSIPSSSKHNFTVEKIGNSPNVMLLRNVLTSEECNAIMNKATDMKAGLTSIENDYRSRKNSFVTWLEYDDESTDYQLEGNTINNLVDSLAASIGYLLLDKSSIFDKFTIDVEKLQIVKYTKDGEYVLHHDGNGRILTVLYYLNGVARTWFPFVNNDLHHPKTRQEAIQYAESYIPGVDGLLVASSLSNDVVMQQRNADCKNIVHVNPGDAIAFYNLETDDEDAILNVRNDWRTIHAGLPNTNFNEKWIATHWFHADDEEDSFNV